MKDNELLAYYQQELAYIRQLGAEFAAAHPKIAGHLRLGAKTIEDPHVARLIEAFAFLTARIQHKLKDDFPEISDALLEVLYPHYLSPIPSFSIVQFQGREDKLLSLKRIERNVLLASDPSYGEVCHFSTCYPVDLWPIKVTKAGINNGSVSAVLSINLSCTQEKLIFSELAFDKLRFYIHADPQQAYLLHELLFKHTVTVALADSDQDKEPVVLDKNCIQAVGFAREEALLPYDARISSAHRLLTEFFILPEKFLFFDIVNLQEAVQKKFTKPGQNLQILIYLDKANSSGEKTIGAQNFMLGCAPIVNIFTKQAEPFYLTPAQSEYQIMPDAQRAPQATEIYAIQRVTVIDKEDKETECKSYHALRYDEQDKPALYYHAARKPAWQSQHYADHGTEVFLSFIDTHFNAEIHEKSVVNVEVLCTNRDLPGQLPFGGGSPRMDFRDNKLDTVNRIQCLIPITPSRRPALQQGARWHLISHLVLNHLSLTADESGIAAIRNILQLYNCNSAPEHNNLLQGLLDIRSQRIILRNPNSRYGNVFWQGTEIILDVDESKFTGTSLYLFGGILERFFALYCTINSFTQLVITARQQGELYRWPPRAGEKVLI